VEIGVGLDRNGDDLDALLARSGTNVLEAKPRSQSPPHRRGLSGYEPGAGPPDWSSPFRTHSASNGVFDAGFAGLPSLV